MMMILPCLPIAKEQTIETRTRTATATANMLVCVSRRQNFDFIQAITHGRRQSLRFEKCSVDSTLDWEYWEEATTGVPIVLVDDDADAVYDKCAIPTLTMADW